MKLLFLVFVFVLLAVSAKAQPHNSHTLDAMTMSSLRR